MTKREPVVFRPLSMAELDGIGFDLDGTLAVYRSAQTSLVITAAVAHLVTRGYSPEIAQLRYEHSFGIRGLLLDKRHGNIVRPSATGGAVRAFHGLAPLPKDVLDTLYPPASALAAGALQFEAETVFSLPVFVLFATLVDFLERDGTRARYNRLFADIMHAMDETLRDDRLGSALGHPWHEYLHLDEEVTSLLSGLRAEKKKLFLLTNATWAHTARVMSWLLADEPAAWCRHFDVIVVEARKPQFFTARRAGERVTSPPLPTPLLRGGDHVALEQVLGVASSRILYVGDSRREDIVPARAAGWHAAFIAAELGGWMEPAGSLESAFWSGDGDQLADDLAHRVAAHASLVIGRVGDLARDPLRSSVEAP